MKLIQTTIPDVVLIEPTVYEDERGWFMESFNEERFHAELKKLGLPIPRRFVQDNHSFSKKGVLRGLHYQHPPHAQGKLVRVVNGSVYDVAVDIRAGSSTYGKCVSKILSSENKLMLWIPEGFAHGFLALEDDVQVLYKVTERYAKVSEGVINWKSPDLEIDWPEGVVIVSEKDAGAEFFSSKVNDASK